MDFSFTYSLASDDKIELNKNFKRMIKSTPKVKGRSKTVSRMMNQMILSLLNITFE